MSERERERERMCVCVYLVPLFLGGRGGGV